MFLISLILVLNLQISYINIIIQNSFNMNNTANTSSQLSFIFAHDTNETPAKDEDEFFCEDFDLMFDKYLADAINKEFEESEDDDDGEDVDIDFGEGNDTDDSDDDDLDDDDLDDDFDLSDDEFMMGSDTSVKVEILPPIDNPRKELNKLIGCKEIKERIDQLIHLSRYNKMILKEDPKAKPHALSLHGLFIGRPGTGKTTVCKIYGSLLRKAGILSRGHVVVAGRSTFVGNYWGDEEKAVRTLIEKAQGGVLMIDEAYQLNSNHQSDPGKMVIPLFMQALADETKRDFAVILCGYKDEIDSLIALNPGLPSRFPNVFEFPEFSFGELLDITRMRIKEYGYHFTPNAWAKYKDVLSQAYAVRNAKTWGNARYVANLLERIYMNHANRCVRNKTRGSRLFTITQADIQPFDPPKAPKRMGF